MGIQDAIRKHGGFLTIVRKRRLRCRRDVPVGVPLDLSTPTGMSCIGAYASQTMYQNIVFYQLLFYYYGMKIDATEKYSKFIINYLFDFLFSED